VGVDEKTDGVSERDRDRDCDVVGVGVEEGVVPAAKTPLITTLSRRSVPVVPKVPVELHVRRKAKDAKLLASAGKAREFAEVQPAVDAVVIAVPNAVKLPVAPVVLYSGCHTFGPVAL
jgi:predicted dehydrogenase